LPSSGDQFASLSATSQNLEPEKFTNYEVGFKWDIYPALAFTAALYQLDRENSPAPDPNNPGVTILIGSTRTEGLELGLNGYVTDEWQVSAGYAHQKGEVTTPGAATQGNDLALVPRDTFSFWNKYMLTPTWGAGVGVIYRTDMFAAVDNAVVLPGYTRVDAALYWNINENLRAQLNIENILNETYYATAHNNNNISPGSPHAAYVTVTSNF
jgi:catecholate siderophore receptor